MALRLPFRLGPRTRKIVRYVGLTLLGLFVFVFALQMSFPYDRVKDKLIDGLSDKWEVSIGSVERGFIPGRIYVNTISLTSRTTKPDQVPTRINIKRLKLDADILPLLSQNLSGSFEATIGVPPSKYGTIAGDVKIGKFGRGNINVNVTGSKVPSQSLPARNLIGLPMTGNLDFSASIGLVREKPSKNAKVAINWQKFRADITLACPSTCTFGDGVTKLKPLLKNTRNQVMVGEGIDFGKVTLDSLSAKVTSKGGKLTLDKFDAKSKDGELKIDYMMTLEKDLDESMVAGCLRFKGSPSLMEREPKTFAALQTTGAELRGDGLFHIRLSDRFKEMKRLNQECGPGTNTNGNGENFGGGNKPPGLTVQPDEPARPGSGVTPSPTPSDTTPTPAFPAPTPTPLPESGSGSANPTGAPTPATPPGGPNTDGVAPGGPPGPSPMPPSTDPPRERAGEQGSAPPPPAGSGNATPPAE